MVNIIVGHVCIVRGNVPSCTPAASPVPFRKEHLHNVVKACLSTRAEPGEAIDWDADVLQLPNMHDSDVRPGILLTV